MRQQSRAEQPGLAGKHAYSGANSAAAGGMDSGAAPAQLEINLPYEDSL